MTSYRDKLLDPRWQRKRLEVFDRDGWKCRSCGDSTKTLHVHHTFYMRNTDPWEYPLESMRALCVDCHKNSHVPDGLADYQVELLRQFENLWETSDLLTLLEILKESAAIMGRERLLQGACEGNTLEGAFGRYLAFSWMIDEAKKQQAGNGQPADKNNEAS